MDTISKIMKSFGLGSFKYTKKLTKNQLIRSKRSGGNDNWVINACFSWLIYPIFLLI